MRYAGDEDAYSVWKKAKLSEDPELIRQAETVLYRVLRRYATSIVYQVLRHRDNDLITDIVAHAFEKAHQFRGDSKFMTWFYRLAYNMCLRELERRKARAEVSLEVLQYIHSTGIERDTLARLGVEELYARLNEEERKLLSFKFLGLEEKDIACALKIGVKAVNQRWLRLRRKLQNLS